MATFDIVSKPDLQKIDNAINVANRKIDQRYDFKGAHIVVELNKKDKTLKVEVPDEMKLKAVKEIIGQSLIDQGSSIKVVDWGKEEQASLGAIRLNCKLNEGLDKELAKTINGKIKDMGMKVKTSIQGDQIRVEAKSIDDLQGVIAMLRESDMPVPLQFENMKR